ncbi:MAG: HAD-IA family hydrolase [Lysobacterales bacterium]
MLRAVLFDLDGTLIDTAADLIGTLDDVRAELGLAPCTAELPPAVAARGGRGLLTLGFPEQPELVERLLPRYLQIYSGRLARLSRPYAGIVQALEQLQLAGIPAAIVTNKPEGLARQLLAELGWTERFAALVGGDTLDRRKPHPEPIWHVCQALQLKPAQTIMVGDDERDIAAGRAAGCALNIATSYGYLEAPDQVGSWGADQIVDDPTQLGAALQRSLALMAQRAG